MKTGRANQKTVEVVLEGELVELVVFVKLGVAVVVLVVVVDAEVVSPGFFRSGDSCHFEVVRVMMRATIEIGLFTSLKRILGLYCL